MRKVVTALFGTGAACMAATGGWTTVCATGIIMTASALCLCWILKKSDRVKGLCALIDAIRGTPETAASRNQDRQLAVDQLFT